MLLLPFSCTREKEVETAHRAPRIDTTALHGILLVPEQCTNAQENCVGVDLTRCRSPYRVWLPGVDGWSS